MPPIPAPLQGLMLYEQDAKLCAKLPENLPAWHQAFRGVDIANEIARAHAWEMAHPARRKKDRIRYLSNWLLRTHERVKAAEIKDDYHFSPEEIAHIEALEARIEREAQWRHGVSSTG